MFVDKEVGGPSGLRKTNPHYNSLAHRTTWLRSDFAMHAPTEKNRNL